MIALAALALAASPAHAVPASFDLAAFGAAGRHSARQEAQRRRYLPADPDPIEADAPDISLRWKLNKVKLKMALDLPY